MPRIVVLSTDGVSFEVDPEIAKVSVAIRSVMESTGWEEENILVRPTVCGEARIVRKVIQWATYHKDDPPPADNNNGPVMQPRITNWDAHFFRMDCETLIKLALSAQHFQINGLYDMTCGFIYNIIRFKTPDEVKRLFGLPDNFFHEE